MQKLFYVDPSSGSVILVKHIDCSSIEYPSLFTLYVDSTSNTTLEYLSVPLRILVKDCDDKSEFNGELINVLTVIFSSSPSQAEKLDDA